jgi:hypothetical protein
VQLRLTYFEDGSEKKIIWSFVPLRDKRQAPQYLRDDRTASDGSPLRRPYAEQRVRLLTFGPSILLQGGDGERKFSTFQRSHVIEINEGSSTKPVWTEYAPDIESQIDLSVMEDIDELVSSEIKFIEKTPRYFHEW